MLEAYRLRDLISSRPGRKLYISAASMAERESRSSARRSAGADDDPPYTAEEVADMLDEIRDMALLMYPNDEAERGRFLADIDASLEENGDDVQEQAMILQVWHATGCDDARQTLLSQPGAATLHCTQCPPSHCISQHVLRRVRPTPMAGHAGLCRQVPR